MTVHTAGKGPSVESTATCTIPKPIDRNSVTSRTEKYLRVDPPPAEEKHRGTPKRFAPDPHGLEQPQSDAQRGLYDSESSP